MLYQPQGAINGMLTRRIDGVRHFLFQARAEPGNAGEVQFGPTLQSTPANYLQFHGGKTSDFFPHFLQQSWATSLLSETTQLDLGSRYLQKTKRVIIAEAVDEVPPVPSFYWLSPEAIRGGVLRDFEINTDFRALIAVSKWSDDPGSGELSPASADIRRSLAAPLRPEVIGDVLHRLAAGEPRKSSFVPIESLENWTLDEDGLREIVPDQNISVGFYAISARYREVGAWTQPLVTASSEGHCVLLARERDGVVEFLRHRARRAGPRHRPRARADLAAVPGRHRAAAGLAGAAPRRRLGRDPRVRRGRPLHRPQERLPRRAPERPRAGAAGGRRRLAAPLGARRPSSRARRAAPSSSG